jgi:dihydroflavonol-4-reductase
VAGLNVLVTGSTGFIGSHLCRAVAAQGHSVRAFHRPSSSLRLLEGLQVEHITGDLAQPESLLAAMEGIEVVFHAAAWMGSQDQPGRLYAVTVEGTRNVLQAALQQGVCRVVHTSSVAALGVPRMQNTSPEGSPALIDENHSWNIPPHWYPYGYAKYLAELEVQKAVAKGLDVVMVNPSLVFGPGDAYRQSTSLVTQVAHRRIPFAIEGGMNVIHVNDVIHGHLAALERGRTGHRYILGNENLTYLQLFALISSVTGSAAPAMVLPGWLVRAAALPAALFQSFLDLPVPSNLLRLAGAHFFFNLRKAREELGWEPCRPAQEAIQDAFTWFYG